MPNPIDLYSLLDTPEPAGLGPGPRSDIRSQQTLEAGLEAQFRESDLTGQQRQLVRALVLLWHDHLEAAHEIAQRVETPDGAFVHGIMHRREPDYGNAAYWFRRVGRHPVFPILATRVAEWLESKSATALAGELMPRGEWDPLAFINACAAAASSGQERQQALLREVQRLETQALLEWLGTTRGD